jgi:autotransporter-associated beta strand protein
VSQTRPGHFAVTGSTTYAEDGSYNISVTITDDGHNTSAFTDTASVSEGVISFTAGTAFTAVETFDSGTQTVANFSDTGLEPATAYSAMIHWGDVNDSAGVVAQTSPGHFAVTGSHTYATPGTYNISVTITDDSVPTTSGTTDTATVVDRLTVINTNDGGPGSLRQVITYANTLPGTSHTIKFAIPAGPQTIQLLSPLPASSVLLVTQLDATQNVNVVSPTGGGQDNFSALTKVGDGSLTLSGANNLTGNLVVTAGTLRFNDTVAPTLAPGITATVAGSGTLDLSGFVSAFTGGSSGTSITNNSSATSGILISGTSQVVGNVDGTGNFVVSAGSDVTANHIIQKALVIGGTAGNNGTVTIDASDALGNSLAAAGGGASSAATQSFVATQAPAAPLIFAWGTLSLLAAPLTDAASVGTAAAISTAAVTAAASDEAGLQSAASAALSSRDAQPSLQAALPSSPQRSTASAIPFSGIGSVEVIVTATDPGASSLATTGEHTSSTGTQAFSTSSSIRSLDGNAVAALFDDANVLEWLADSRQSRSSPNEVVDSLNTDALSDDVLSTIGQQWQG